MPSLAVVCRHGVTVEIQIVALPIAALPMFFM
jgi:hypothetical protein